MKLPEKSLKEEEIFDKLNEYQARDISWRSGRVLGYIYDAGKAAEEIGKKAYMMFLTENGLDPTIFPSLLQMELDVVSMAASRLGGDDQIVGNFTSGGTESILLAVKTARDYCRYHQPQIKTPEMILPVTAHAAFHKAAKYFDVKVVPTPVDDKTFKADVSAMEAAITPDTILMVGSAPSYAHGVVDPIPEMGQLALKNNLLLHTDGCVGGFILPFLKELGEPITDFGFDVPGVTSISLDLHKYAYTPKNASLVLYKDKSIRRYQLFACANWPGYSVVNNTIQSSKTGGPLAAAWAVLNYLGGEGYREIARQTRQATLKLVEGIKQIEGLRVLAHPEMFMFSVASDTINVFHIVDQMSKRDWYIQPQLSFENSPKNFHISVNMSNVALVDDLLENLRDSVELARNQNSGELVKSILELLVGMGPNDINQENIAQMMEMAEIGGGVPDEMSDINEILNALPLEHRELLLTEFLNDLFVTNNESKGEKNAF